MFILDWQTQAVKGGSDLCKRKWDSPPVIFGALAIRLRR